MNKKYDEIIPALERPQTVKLQASVEENTEKEITPLQETAEKLREERLGLIIQIGNELHKKMRLQGIVEPEFTEYFHRIEELDKEIYITIKNEERLRMNSLYLYNCTECGSKLTLHDKFCGSCGTSVLIPEKNLEELGSCTNCEEEIPHSAIFCPCCGRKTAVSQES
ncbi:zinc ribbon domain-containing protein [Planococcus sp. CAU13]|uniref:zinc ribbon domain-containing protein n=1 Tax=Planococcus sp. CAU13 TaxID=1541197 RepID=UPI00068EC176|nr:zinc ribbon domain-containing protein [Planococcus sp. CAU13]